MAPDPSEREKWEADIRLRERELAVKEREQEIKHREVEAKAQELKRSRWTNPLVLAVLAAALAAGGSAVVALINGAAQRASDNLRTTAEDKLQAVKASAERQLEEGKAEAARILEMIKTADSDKAAVNLRFLLDAGLIVDPDRREKLAAFLKTREPGKGPSLPAAPTVAGAAPLPLFADLASQRTRFETLSDLLRLGWSNKSYECVLKDQQNADSLSDAMLSDLESKLSDLESSSGAGFVSIRKINSNIEFPVKSSVLGSLPPLVRTQAPDLLLGSILISGSGNRVRVILDLSGTSTGWIKDVALESLRRLSTDPSCAAPIAEPQGRRRR